MKNSPVYFDSQSNSWYFIDYQGREHGPYDSEDDAWDEYESLSSHRNFGKFPDDRD